MHMSLRARQLAWSAAVSALMAGPAAAQHVAEVQIAPSTATLSVNQEMKLLATTYDASGNPVVVPIKWSSTNPNVVRVQADTSTPGLSTLIGIGPGSAQVEAEAGGKKGVVPVQVIGGAGGAVAHPGTGTATILKINPGNILLLPSESRQLNVLFLKNDGSNAAPQIITWRSLQQGVASVSDQGVVTAVGQGSGVIEARSQSGLTTNAPVQVTPAPFAFAAPVASLSPGQEDTLDVVVPSQGNRKLPISGLSFTSSDLKVAQVTPLGVVKAVGAGKAKITATGFLQSHAIDVRVHPPVATLTAIPGPSAGTVIVPLSGTKQFQVKALAAGDVPIPDVPMIWSVKDTAIASFDGNSQVLHGKKIGKTELHLDVPGSSVAEVVWPVNVIAGGLLLNHQRAGISVGDTIALRASFTDTQGAPIGAASGVKWSSTKPAVAQVTATGTVTAVAVGRTDIVGSTSWGKADTLQLYVQGGVLVTSTRGGSPDLYAFDRGTPSRLTRVTSDTAAEVSGAYSPDGSRIAFVSTRGGNADIWTCNADGSGWAQLTKTPGAEDAPAWTPDGTQIVYAAQAPGAGTHPQVWIMNADGSGAKQLTKEGAANFQPAVSPDGKTIAFASTRDGNYDIYLMNRDGSNERNVTKTPNQRETQPHWFPNGELAYLVEQSGGGGISAVVMRKNLTSGKVTAVSPAGLAVTDFAVAPQGDMLALQEQTLETAGVVSKVLLLPLGGGGPLEVPRSGATDQMSGPAFRPLRSH